MARLTLLVPALFWPDPEDPRPAEGLRLPALERLMARGERRELGAGEQAWALSAFGLDPADAAPLAAASLAGLGGDPAGAAWLRADPVHLQPRGVELFLSRPGPGDVTPGEAAALAETLNAFFAADALRFEALRPDAWFVRLPAAAALAAVSTDAAHGRSVDALLPSGPQARTWLRRVNEAQMLLHDHPVNIARERDGRLPLNSLWIWGGAALPVPPRRPAARLLGEAPVLRGLAAAAGMAIEAVPPRWPRGAGPTGMDTLVEWEAARRAAGVGDVDGWRAALRHLDGSWIAPALADLAARRLEEVTVAGFAGRAGAQWRLGPREAWRFWRRPRPLSACGPRR